MSVEGFVLIRVKPGFEKKIFNVLMDMEEVEGLRMVFGEYDLIVKVITNNLKTLISTVIERIRSIEGVADTTTLMAAEEAEE